MASHSGCYSIYPHPRNIKDDVLDGLDELDGYIGIPLITFFLGKENTDPYMEFVRHIRHASSIVGIHSVGIGSDSPHQNTSLEDAQRHFNTLMSKLKTDASLDFRFPDRPWDIIERGRDLFSVMEEHIGYDRSVLGENFVNFLKRALPG